jgi:folate-binding protein YgfZ
MSDAALPTSPWAEACGAGAPVRIEGDVQVLDGDGDVTAAETGAALIDLGAHRLLRLRGPNSADFLHRIIAQDVAGQRDGETRRAVVLDRKGRVVAAVRLERVDAEDVWLQTLPGQRDAARAELAKYAVVEDCDFAPDPAVDSLAQVWLLGPQAEARLAAAGLPRPPADGFTALGDADSGEMIVDRPLGEIPGVVARIGPDRLPAVAAAWRDLAVLGLAAFDALRIPRGIPAPERDFAEPVMARESGLDAGVSYTKGCYIGQEPTYRLAYRGKPAKRLMRLTLDGPAALGDELLTPGKPKPIGSLVAVAGRHALGFVARSALNEQVDGPNPEAVVALSSGAGVTVGPAAAW